MLDRKLLKKLMRYKQNISEISRQKLLTEMNEIKKLEKLEESIRENQSRLHEVYNEQNNISFAQPNRQIINGYLAFLDKRCNSIQREMSSKNEALVELRKNYLEDYKEYKKVEILRNEQEKLYKLEKNRQELKQMDQIASNKFVYEASRKFSQKLIVFFVALFSLSSSGLWAQQTKDAVNTTAPDTNLQKSIQFNANKKNLSVSQGSLLLDLNREIELARRQRKNKQQQKVANEELQIRLKELKKVSKDLSKIVDIKKQENKNFDLLVKLYESITPDQAVKLLKELPINISVEMIKRMSPAKSSKLLAAMEEKMAVEVSRRLINTKKRR